MATDPTDRGHVVTIPLEGLGLGKQLRYLKCVRTPIEHADIDRFFELMSQLRSLPAQGLRLAEYTGRTAFPKRGVYFFLEDGEQRKGRPEIPRIVRVGTHAVSANSRSTLWRRLRTHRGARNGTGNHRGSIFRLHVGTALLERDSMVLPTWGQKSSAPRDVRAAEADHEQRVSAHIGKMRILWVDVPDEPGPQSQRAFIERNAIALLSNQLKPIDPPSPSWLGARSTRAEIRASGLWNLNHVNEQYDPRFLDILADAIDRMTKA